MKNLPEILPEYLGKMTCVKTRNVFKQQKKNQTRKQIAEEEICKGLALTGLSILSKNICLKYGRGWKQSPITKKKIFPLGSDCCLLTLSSLNSVPILKISVYLSIYLSAVKQQCKNVIVCYAHKAGRKHAWCQKDAKLQRKSSQKTNLSLVSWEEFDFCDFGFFWVLLFLYLCLWRLNE